MARERENFKLRRSQATTLFEIARFKLEKGHAATLKEFAAATGLSATAVSMRRQRLKPFLVWRPGVLEIDGRHTVDRRETARVLLRLMEQYKTGSKGDLMALAEEESIHTGRFATLSDMLVKNEYIREIVGWPGSYEVGPRTENELEYIRLLAAPPTPTTKHGRRRIKGSRKRPSLDS